MNYIFKHYNEDFSKTLKISVYYSKGGMNYFTSTNEKRGYYLSVTPVEITQGNGYQTESVTAFSGIKQLLVETKRSSKAGETKALAEKDSHIQTLIDYVVSKNNLKAKPILYTVTNIDNIVKTFTCDEQFLDYAKKIYKENEDSNPYPSEIHWLPENIQQAKEYIHEYCDNLTLTEN